MKNIYQRRSEALERNERRIKHWEKVPAEVAKVEILAYKDFSNKDVEFIRAETLEEHVRLTSVLAERKIKNINRDIGNLRRKLGKG